MSHPLVALTALAAALREEGVDPDTASNVMDRLLGMDQPEWPRLILLEKPLQLVVSGPGIVTYDGAGIRWDAR